MRFYKFSEIEIFELNKFSITNLIEINNNENSLIITTHYNGDIIISEIKEEFEIKILKNFNFENSPIKNLIKINDNKFIISYYNGIIKILKIENSTKLKISEIFTIKEFEIKIMKI